ncbi:MAG: CBS domain-containing protein [Candidatus Omnitrophica bacterium]|nr:CBS domain-containing protein [Candidatus Omnitrophota bacterium]
MDIQCLACGAKNIEGEDRCRQCLHSLMQVDLPRPKKSDPIQQIMMSTPVSELLTGEDLLVASPEDSIAKVVEIFQKEKKHCILVYEKKRLAGILSKRDLVFKVAGKPKDLSKFKVRDIMTPKAEFVKADAPLAFVVNKMALGGFRHVPVLAEDGKPLSIIHIQDVLDYLLRREKNPKK